MSDAAIFVSHAPADLESVEELFATVRNFPIDVRVAGAADRGRGRLRDRISSSDVVAAVLTDGATDCPWIDQEIGYAVATGTPVLPLYDDPDRRAGYLRDVEGVRIDRETPSETVFDLLSRLREELSPLGPLTVPNWYVRFPCTTADCVESVTLEVDAAQPTLRKLAGRGRRLSTTCESCDAIYRFDPATIGYVGRDDGR